MNIDQAREIAQLNMATRDIGDSREPGYIYHHGRRTAQIALHLADRVDEPVERDILDVAALFHDIGKGHQRHNEVGACMMRELLGPHCSPAKLERICQLILEHPQRVKPNAYSLETIILQDADLLDHFGPIRIWWFFAWAAGRRDSIDDALRVFRGQENADIQSRMRDALNLDVAVEILDGRLAFETEFFAEFERVHREGL